MDRFYIQSTQYANGSYEVAYLIVDRNWTGIMMTTTSEKHAEEIVKILNVGHKAIGGAD